MKRKKRKGLPGRLERARRRFERWRATRRERRIPDRLWEEAAGLGAEFGVHRTARALRLNYEGLKKRVNPSSVEKRRERRTSEGGAKTSGFVPLMSTGFMGGEGSAEYERADGSRMRVEWKGAAPELSSLSESFFNGGG